MDYATKWHKELIQGTDDWHALRAGRFGASGIKDILTKPRAKKDADKLSAGAKTKAQGKAFEALLGASAPFQGSAATDWGNEWEDKARLSYEEETLTDVSEVGYIEYGADAGVSPDGVIYDESKLIEIKCPYNQHKHLENCLHIVDNESFKKLRPEYFYQVQYQMMVSGYKECDFVSFDPRLEEVRPDLMLHIVSIEACPEAFELIQERLQKAIQFKHEVMQCLKK